MSITTDTRGLYTIAPTPFEANGAIDWKSVDAMVDFYERCGVHGITKAVKTAVSRPSRSTLLCSGRPKRPKTPRCFEMARNG
jgi:hypothetical protein